jgi:hypothetical protein
VRPHPTTVVKANLLRRWLRDLDGTPHTVTGWQVAFSSYF